MEDGLRTDIWMNNTTIEDRLFVKIAMIYISSSTDVCLMLDMCWDSFHL